MRPPTATGHDRGVGIRVGSTVVNVVDLEVMTSFWCAALDLVPSSTAPDDDFRVLRGDRVNVSLQVARTPVTARGQVHLDLYSDDLEAQLRRLQGLGATVVHRAVDEGEDVVVLHDPEGNPFCVCAKEQL